MKCWNFNNGNAELLGQDFCINNVAALFEQVNHVQANDDRTTCLKNLCGQIEVALKVGNVKQVDDGIGALVYNVITRDRLFRRIWWKRINTRQVNEGNVFIYAPCCLLLLNGNTWPVADISVWACQFIKQSGLTAVWITCKTNNGFFGHPLLL